MNRPLTTIGPYSVHLATPGWYCVIKSASGPAPNVTLGNWEVWRKNVVFTAASAAEAILWACIQHESETETEKEAIQ